MLEDYAIPDYAIPVGLMDTLSSSFVKSSAQLGVFSSFIEDGLRFGPLHIVKRNRPSAVVLSEDEYLRLI